MSTDREILTRDEVAERLSVGPHTIKRWHDRGLPVIVVNERTFRYKWADVEKWLDERTVTTTGLN